MPRDPAFAAKQSTPAGVPLRVRLWHKPLTDPVRQFVMGRPMFRAPKKPALMGSRRGGAANRPLVSHRSACPASQGIYAIASRRHDIRLGDRDALVRRLPRDGRSPLLTHRRRHASGATELPLCEHATNHCPRDGAPLPLGAKGAARRMLKARRSAGLQQTCLALHAFSGRNFDGLPTKQPARPCGRRRSPSLVSWPLEALGCAPRVLQRSFSAREDLLDALVDPHDRVVREVTDRFRESLLEGHSRAPSCPVR